jgi:uroporphyrinogen-III synthase
VKPILILRAEEDALRTAEKLRHIGYSSILSPVIKIHPTHAKAPIADYDALIASSAKAFETAIEIESFAHLPVHAVGAKTALSARNKGFEPEIVAGKCGSNIASLIAKIS